MQSLLKSLTQSIGEEMSSPVVRQSAKGAPLADRPAGGPLRWRTAPLADRSAGGPLRWRTAGGGGGVLAGNVGGLFGWRSGGDCFAGRLQFHSFT